MGNIKFGTDGWRAIIEDEFNVDNVKIVAQAIADYVNTIDNREELRNKEIIIGYDTRRNSEKYAKAVAEVLTGNSIKVLLTDRVTSTPAVSFAIKNRNLTGGVMITASHNPPQYNGLKYKPYYSGSASPEITSKIEKALYKSDVRQITLEEAKTKGLLKIDNVIPEQLDFILRYVDMELLKESNLKILVDIMYGAGNRYIESLLKGTNCKVETIHTEHDTNFGGINPEPISENLKELVNLIKRGSFDIGIATDGDVDRVGCVAPDGSVLDGQKIMALLLWHFAEDKRMRGAVVTTVCGSMLIRKLASRYGLKLYETPVGFKYICEIMRKEDVLIGGEEAGGIGFKGYIPERDGILSALLLLEMLAYRRRGLVTILDDMEKEFGSYYYLKTSVECNSPDKKDLTQLLKNPPRDILGRKISEVSTLDGVKFICEDSSWLLFRASGTEPILRIYSESKTIDEAQKILEFGNDLISRS